MSMDVISQHPSASTAPKAIPRWLEYFNIRMFQYLSGLRRNGGQIPENLRSYYLIPEWNPNELIVKKNPLSEEEANTILVQLGGPPFKRDIEKNLPLIDINKRKYLRTDFFTLYRLRDPGSYFKWTDEEIKKSGLQSAIEKQTGSRPTYEEIRILAIRFLKTQSGIDLLEKDPTKELFVHNGFGGLLKFYDNDPKKAFEAAGFSCNAEAFRGTLHPYKIRDR